MVQEKVQEHKPVLVHEVLAAFDIEKQAPLHSQVKIIDATLGAGGHSIEFIKRGIFVLGIDNDPVMLDIAREKLTKACPATFSLHERSLPFKLHLGNFRDIDSIAQTYGVVPNGILVDLGISSIQQLDLSRGFSFNFLSADLDMRLNPETQGVRALDLLNALPESKLVELFETILDWKESRILSKKVIERRAEQAFKKVGDFVDVIKSAKGFRSRNPKVHEETLPFMALRIAVNSELENLKLVLPKAFDLLTPGGRLVVITFHSGEDKIVKEFFNNIAEQKIGELLYKKPVGASEDEIKSNPRSRSAKLRAIRKII